MTMAKKYQEWPEEKVRELYDEYYIGQDRSVGWIAENGPYPCDKSWLYVLFQKYNLPTKKKLARHQTKALAKAQPKPATPATSSNGAGDIVMTPLPATLADQVRQAWEQLEMLEQLGELTVKAVTLSFELTIGVARG